MGVSNNLSDFLADLAFELNLKEGYDLEPKNPQNFAQRIRDLPSGPTEACVYKMQSTFSILSYASIISASVYNMSVIPYLCLGLSNGRLYSLGGGLDSIKRIESSGIYYQTSITGSMELKNCEYIGDYGMYMTQLSALYLPNAKEICSWAFAYGGLSSLYLLGSQVATTNDKAVVAWVSKVYVPSSLYNAYITAPYWSDRASKFVSV